MKLPLAFALIGIGLGFIVGRRSVSPPPAVPVEIAAEPQQAPRPPAPSARPTERPRQNLVGAEDPKGIADANLPVRTADEPSAKETPQSKNEEDAPDNQAQRFESVVPMSSIDDARKVSVFADRAAQARRGNLNAFVNNARPINKMTPALRGILGRFEGEVLLDDDTKRTWQISTEAQGKIDQGGFQGNFLCQLARNGRVFVTSAQSGSVKNIKFGTGKDLSLLIEISPQYYIDAYYDGESDALYGNLYVRTSPERVKVRGFAQLTRIGQ